MRSCVDATRRRSFLSESWIGQQVGSPESDLRTLIRARCQCQLVALEAVPVMNRQS